MQEVIHNPSIYARKKIHLSYFLIYGVHNIWVVFHFQGYK